MTGAALVLAALLTSSATAQPVNDDCLTAIPVMAGVDVTQDPSVLAGPWDTTGATADLEDPSCSSNQTAVWFEFTAQTDSIYRIHTEGTSDDTTMAIFDTCGGVEIECDDDGGAGLTSSVVLPLATGDTVYVMLFHYGSNTNPVVDGVLNVEDLGPPPANDDCASADPLLDDGSILAFTTVGAGTSALTSSCGPTSSSDVWMALTAASDGVLIVDAECVAGDLDLSLWSSCGASFELACSNVGYGSATLTRTVFAGDMLLVRIATMQPSGTTGEVSAEVLPPAPNDACGSAELAIVDGPATSLDFIRASDSGTAASCGTTPDADLWFEVVASVDGALAFTVDTQQGDSGLQLFDGCGGTELECVDDGFGTAEELALVGAVAGQSILVRVTNDSTGIAELEVRSVGSVAGKHVIVAAEQGAGTTTGQIDSVAAIESALIANGVDATSIEVVDPMIYGAGGNLLGEPASIWLQFGTYPQNSEPSDFPGLDSNVRAFVLAGTPLYLSGGDLWGFDDPGVLFDVDGVDSATDGDDSHVDMTGLDFAVGLDNAYAQDNTGTTNDYIDQLTVSTSDLLGADATAIWQDTTSSYTTGVRYQTQPAVAGDPVPGNVVSVSTEFGGIGQGDAMQQQLVMAEYMTFFGISATGSGPRFIRADVDEDGLLGIADATRLLAVLFVSGSPQPQCRDTADVNADGQLGLADTIALLAYLFTNGAPPAAPFPDCGPLPAGFPSVGCTASSPSCP